VATNQFVQPFDAAGSNAYSPSALAALSNIASGVLPGIGDPLLYNSLCRQSGVWAFILGQLIVNQLLVDADDDNTYATLLANLPLALGQANNSSNAVTDTGTANAVVITLSPVPVSLAAMAGRILLITKSASANTGAVTINSNSLGATALVKANGAALVNGDWAAGTVGYVYCTGTGFKLLNTPISSFGGVVGGGQCRFVYTSTTVVTLFPKNGNVVVVGGAPVALPAAGVTAANTSVYVNGTPSSNLAASTTYFVSLSLISGTPTLQFWNASTYSHILDTTAGNIGIEVISLSGTPSTGQSLVGMVTTNASSQFQVQGVGTSSWFNRRAVGITGVSSSGATTTSMTLVELSSTLRVYFQAWALESISSSVGGTADNSSSGNSCNCAVGLDGVAESIIDGGMYSTPGGASSGLFSQYIAAVTEGSHYVTPMVNVSSGTGAFALAASCTVFA
jgi:hypothetical protein